VWGAFIRFRSRPGIARAPRAEFLRTQADSILASDFFTVYSLWGATLYVLFFIELSTRRVHVAGCTARPDSEWVTQQARNLSVCLEDRAKRVRFLIHDRDAKYGGGFDVVFRASGVEVIRTPVKAPRANAFAERWVKTVKSECLDWLLMSDLATCKQSFRTMLITTTLAVPTAGWSSSALSRIHALATLSLQQTSVEELGSEGC
jgi:putative transposase